MNLIPLAEFGEEDFVARASGLIEQGGINAIEQAFHELRGVGIDPASIPAQPVLIEAIFHLLDGLEKDLASPLVHPLVFRLDRDIAQAAADMLILAHFPDGSGELADLGDGAVLLLIALMAAADKRAEAVDILWQAKLSRPAPRFQYAAVQLHLLIQPDVDAVMQFLLAQILDGCDHPEIWAALPAVTAHFPDLTAAIADIIDQDQLLHAELWGVIHALCVAAEGDPVRGFALLEPIATDHSQSILAQGAFFYIRSLLDPGNPTYDLSTKFCVTPFETLDILDGKSHLCCASWLPHSVGDLADQPFDGVWNSDAAQSIRASVLDGSFRFCNKTACPQIAGNSLPEKEKLASESDRWRDIIANFRTRLATRPHRLNLAYDESCNLSCPSCRTGKIAADSAMRARFDKLQEEKILPLLRDAKLVFISGLGDPFASKNFRNLIDRLGPDEYPDLRFQLMTNGMLFTRREWARFPALHRRVAYLRISIDAATGPTHELLRRGARWPVMEENLAFARELRAEGLIGRLDFAFAVQIDNYREMGDAVDLARHFGGDHIGFTRITNWGTFSAEDYAQKAIFMPAHPDHADFIARMQDPRLRDPIVGLNDLSEFART